MLRHFSLFAVVGTFALGTAACSGAPDGDHADSTTSDLTEADQLGIDAQVLQVWTPGRLFPTAPQPWNSPSAKDVSIDAATGCTTLSTNSWSHWLDTTVDCSAAFAAAAPFDVTHAAGPVLAPVKFTVSKDTTGTAVYVDPDFCSYVELRVVAREAAVNADSFAGIGFYTSRGDSFTAKDQLQEVGRTRLVNGDAAIVYRFTSISTCISSAHNSTSGNEYQTFSFKPYAAFDAQVDGDTRRFRVWERINGNHAVGRSWPGSTPVVNATGFDRQNDLLAH